MSTKLCPGSSVQSKHVEDVDQFSKDASRVDGLAPYCKVCAAAKQREWKHANPGKVKAMKAAYLKKEEA